MKKPYVVVFGFGEIGSVLFSLLKKQKYHVEAWDKTPQKVSNQKSLFEIIPKADILFLCVPSWVLGDVVRGIKPFVHAQTVIVTLSKGLQQTKETAHAFLSKQFPNNEVVVFGGAMLAEEVERGMPGVAVIATKKETVAETVAECFGGTNIICFKSKNPEAVCYASVLKNIYALGLGIAHGAGFGGNGRALLARNALFEMEEIGKILGIKPGLMYGPAGFVDLIATGFSEFSKNVEVGELIVKTNKPVPNSEGLVSLEPMRKILGSAASALPLFTIVCRMAFRKDSAPSTLHKYLKKIEKNT